MNLAIIGSRGFNNYDLLKNTLLQICKVNDINFIVSGGAKGADSLAERFAKEFKIKTKIFSPDWKNFGRAAGPIRNIDIIKNADFIIAFWDGRSKGTKNSINLALKNNKKLKVVEYE